MRIKAEARDPWRRVPVGELQEQLLPRWFVVSALVLAVAAVAVAAAAFVVVGPGEVPVAARRPPPAQGLTNAVGQFRVGESDPIPYDAACPLLDGVQVAGNEVDRLVLRRGLAGLCNTVVDDVTERALRRFAAAGGVVRFAQFEATGVDSTGDMSARPPRILVNARFALTDPLWIAPLMAHDAILLDAEALTAEAALRARRVEADVCRRLLAGRRESRGCADAAQLLALPDPESALREAGYH
jgi:hypothetical protein